MVCVPCFFKLESVNTNLNVCSRQCSTTGVTKAMLCAILSVYIKEPLLLIRKSSPCGGSGFPLSLSGPLPYV